MGCEAEAAAGELPVIFCSCHKKKKKSTLREDIGKTKIGLIQQDI